MLKGGDVLGDDSKAVDGLQHRGEKDTGEIGGVYLTSHLERTYTTTLLVMVDGVKGGGRAPPAPALTRPG
jgi:hypothetical protein